LFRRSPGYIETLLLKDRSQPQRYLTIDRWRNEAAWLAFQSDFAQDYAQLDRECESLTEHEASMGSFSCIQPQASIAHVALLVRDYDEAIAWYTGTLGFRLIEDSPRPEPGKRWVLVAPPGTGTQLLLARAVGPAQQRWIGNQSGGRVFLFLQTDDFWSDYQSLQARGVRFVREPSVESYGTVAVFEDLYGNRWDLLQYGLTAREA
jgi:catechol 2,3-dioxygenase-like lactoylglutathione lyase family enzyme